MEQRVERCVAVPTVPRLIQTVVAEANLRLHHPRELLREKRRLSLTSTCSTGQRRGGQVVAQQGRLLYPLLQGRGGRQRRTHASGGGGCAPRKRGYGTFAVCTALSRYVEIVRGLRFAAHTLKEGAAASAGLLVFRRGGRSQRLFVALVRGRRSRLLRGVATFCCRGRSSGRPTSRVIVEAICEARP